MNQVSRINNRQLELINQRHLSATILKPHKARIKRQLHKLGADRHELQLPETNMLPLVVRADERIQGIVFGTYKQATLARPLHGRGALVATDQRVLLIDHKPLYIRCDELSYSSVSAVSYRKVGFGGTIVLHNSLGDISLQTMNQNGVDMFVAAIEDGMLAANERRLS